MATLNRYIVHEFKYNRNITNFEMKFKKKRENKNPPRPTYIYIKQ